MDYYDPSNINKYCSGKPLVKYESDEEEEEEEVPVRVKEEKKEAERRTEYR